MHLKLFNIRNACAEEIYIICIYLSIYIYTTLLKFHSKFLLTTKSIKSNQRSWSVFEICIFSFTPNLSPVVYVQGMSSGLLWSKLKPGETFSQSDWTLIDFCKTNTVWNEYLKRSMEQLLFFLCDSNIWFTEKKNWKKNRLIEILPNVISNWFKKKKTGNKMDEKKFTKCYKQRNKP